MKMRPQRIVRFINLFTKYCVALCCCMFFLSSPVSGAKPYITSWDLVIDSSIQTFNGVKSVLADIDATLNDAMNHHHNIRGQRLTLTRFSLDYRNWDDPPAVYIPTYYRLHVETLGINGCDYVEEFLHYLFPEQKWQLHDYEHGDIDKNVRMQELYRLIHIKPKPDSILSSNLFSAIDQKYSPKFFVNERSNQAYVLLKLPYDFVAERADLTFKELYEQEQREIIEKLFSPDAQILLTVTAYGFAAKNNYDYYYEEWVRETIAFALVEKTFANFGTRETIRQYYSYANKKSSAKLTRAIRTTLIELQDGETIKRTFRTWLKQASCEHLGLSLKELTFHVRLMQDVLAWEGFLGKDISSKICISEVDGIRPFSLSLITHCIKKTTNLKAEVLSSAINEHAAHRLLAAFTADDKVNVFLLHKKDSYHCAPLIRISDDNSIYWILLESNAEKDAWFSSSNFEQFFTSLKLLIKAEKTNNPDKEVSGFINRIQLITQDTGCEVTAFLNCRAVAVHLPEFISFLKECDHANKKEGVIIFPSLPYFIIAHKQGLRGLKQLTYKGLDEKAREEMALLPIGSQSKKLANASVLFGSIEILEELVEQLTPNKANSGKDIYDIEEKTCVIQ